MTVSGCAIDDCPEPLSAKGFCLRHYKQDHYQRNKQTYIDRVKNRRVSGLADRGAEGRRYYAKNKDACLERTERWRQANPEKVRDIRENRRTRERDAFVEVVSRELVWAIHLGLCGICFKSVALREMELDHIVPLSREGKHRYSNCQPAHMVCNRRKASKVVA